MEDYINQTPAAGVHVTEATPLDDRIIVTSEADLSVLQNVEPMPSRMYHGMTILCLDTYKRYIWLPASSGLMHTGYTYPEWYDDINGRDYAGLTYNFLLLDESVKLNITTTSQDAINGYIHIPWKVLPLKIFTNPSSAHVVLKSSDSTYQEEEFADKITYDQVGVRIYLAPFPTAGTIFRVTIH